MKKTLLLTLFSITFSLVAQAQWQRLQTYPFKDSVRYPMSIHRCSTDPNNAWVLMRDSKAPINKFKYAFISNKGKALKETTAPSKLPTDVLIETVAVDSNRLFALTINKEFSDAFVRETKDGGKTWNTTPNIFTDDASFVGGIHFWDSQNGCAIGDAVDGYFEVFTTKNSGTTWTRLSKTSALTQKSPDEYSILGTTAACADGSMYVALSELTAAAVTWTRILYSTDKGQTWESNNFPDIINSDSLGTADEAYALPGVQPGLVQFTTFEAASKNELVVIRAFQQPSGPPNLYAFVTKNGGKTWLPPSKVNRPADLFAIYMRQIQIIPNTNILYVLGNNSANQLFSFVSTNYGANWNMKAINKTAGLVNIPTYVTSYFANFSTPTSGLMTMPDGLFNYTGNNISPIKEAIPTIQLTLNSYPNPATDLITIEFDLDKPAKGEVAIIDLLGRKVAQIVPNNSQFSEGKQHFQWQPNESGTFLISVEIDGEHFMRQINVIGK